LTKRAALYPRVSIDQQTTENQRLVLEEVAQRNGRHIACVLADEGIRGANGRDKRPAFHELLNKVVRREIDVVMSWSVGLEGHCQT